MTRLPPGPSFAALETLRYFRDSFAYLAEMLREYGDPVCIPTLSGTLVVTGDAEGARTVFTADPDIFEVRAPELLAPLLGPTSLFLESGTRHRAERKLLAPAFHGARTRAYGEIIASATERAIAGFVAGTEIAMHDAMRGVSLDVILRAVFGIADRDRIDRFRDAATMLYACTTADLLFFHPTRRRADAVDENAWSSFQIAKARFDAFVDDEIRARRAHGSSGEDILSMMLAARYDDGSAMSDVALRTELVTLLLAGYETTATALTWAMYWLHRHDEIRGRLLDELNATDRSRPDGLAALGYLDAVCNESLRLYPITADVPRQLRAPLALKGYALPAGCGVTVALSVLHMRDDVFPAPTEFRPERFVERKYSSFEFAPFGGGSRRCLGAAFALYEMKIVLATMLTRCRLRLVSDTVPAAVRHTIMFGPEGGVPMLYEGSR